MMVLTSVYSSDDDMRMRLRESDNEVLRCTFALLYFEISRAAGRMQIRNGKWGMSHPSVQWIEFIDNDWLPIASLLLLS